MPVQFSIRYNSYGLFHVKPQLAEKCPHFQSLSGQNTNATMGIQLPPKREEVHIHISQEDSLWPRRWQGWESGGLHPCCWRQDNVQPVRRKLWEPKSERVTLQPLIKEVHLKMESLAFRLLQTLLMHFIQRVLNENSMGTGTRMQS